MSMSYLASGNDGSHVARTTTFCCPSKFAHSMLQLSKFDNFVWFDHFVVIPPDAVFRPG